MGGLRESGEESAISKVLQQIQQNPDPQTQQNMMNQILMQVAPERRQAAAQMMQQTMQQGQANLLRQRRGQAYQEAGLPASTVDFPETVQAAMVGQKGKQNVAQEKLKTKQGQTKYLLGIVDRQRELLKTGHLGGIQTSLGKTGRDWGSGFESAGTSARAEYERLGKALISQATSISIRNLREFETIADKLYDPNISQEEIKGTIDAMERIIKKDYIEEQLTSNGQDPDSISNAEKMAIVNQGQVGEVQQKQKRPLSAFEGS
jgi:hypothetical protein